MSDCCLTPVIRRKNWLFRGRKNSELREILLLLIQNIRFCQSQEITMPATTALPRSTPEAQGIPSAAITRFVEAVEANISELHSFVLLRHGSVVAEGWWAPYRPELPHMLFSLSKSFTSSAIGLAAAENLLSLDDPVISFFPDELPAQVSANLAAMQVRHLLSMSTGHAEDTLPAVQRGETAVWTTAFLACPVEFQPGTHFVYNSGATYMLSAILQKVAGQKLLDYLQPRLMQPLGIEGAAWEVSPQGINTGGWGLSIRTEDIARFAQLYLQKGKWNGAQLLPEAWVEEATSKKISNGDDPNSDWSQGYAYQFWRCRHGAYRGDGAFGQYAVVMPAQDAALAITSGVADMQSVLNLVWEHLLPAMSDAPLPENSTDHAALTTRLESLALPPVQGSPTPPAAYASEQSYALGSNPLGIESIAIAFEDATPTLTAKTPFGDLEVKIGQGVWQEGVVQLPFMATRYAVSGAWTGDDTYTIRLRFTETPFYFTIISRFSGNTVQINADINVFFYPIRYQLVGRSA